MCSFQYSTVSTVREIIYYSHYCIRVVIANSQQVWPDILATFLFLTLFIFYFTALVDFDFDSLVIISRYNVIRLGVINVLLQEILS